MASLLRYLSGWRLSERRNQRDLQINLFAEQADTEQLRLLRLLCENAGIPVNAPECEIQEQQIADNGREFVDVPQKEAPK